jgi:hypothetical protein
MESKWFVEDTATAPVPLTAPPARPAAPPARTPESVTSAPPRYGLVGSACGVGGLLVGFIVGLVVAFGIAGARKPTQGETPVAAASLAPATEAKFVAMPPALPGVDPISANEELPAPREDRPTLVAVNEKPAAVVAAPAPPEALPPGELPKPARAPGTDTCGTAVEFMLNPLEALEVATKDKKLMFVMHISGNFEEAKFT